MKKAILMIAAFSILMCLTACGKTCANGCGAKANSKCMADMCDNCCDYWMGLNGCYANH